MIFSSPVVCTKTLLGEDDFPSLSYVVINVLYTSSSCNIIICKFENTKEKRSTHTVHKMSSLRCLPEDSMPIIFLLDTAEFGSHREMWKSLLTTIVINFR